MLNSRTHTCLEHKYHNTQTCHRVNTGTVLQHKLHVLFPLTQSVVGQGVTGSTSQSKLNSITRPGHGNNQIAKRHVYTIHWLQMLILILTQLFWQYRTPSSPEHPSEREAYSSQQETRRATYFTLRRNSRGRRRIPKFFKSTPISLVREAARIQQIFWEMSQSKQQPKGGQPPPASPSPQPGKSGGGGRANHNDTGREGPRKRQRKSNHFDHTEFSIKPLSKKSKKFVS